MFSLRKSGSKRANEEHNGIPVAGSFSRPQENDDSQMHLKNSEVEDGATKSFGSVYKKMKVERSTSRTDIKVQQLPTLSPRPNNERKFPLSYIGMIAQAINSSSEKKLILADIYCYMECHFFHYLCNKPRWKNTVRHNLSFHKCFVKCECSSKGSRSHYWTIHPDYIEQFNRGNFSKMLEATNFPKYVMNNIPWTGQQFDCLNQGELQPSFPMPSPAFSFGSFTQYDSLPPPKTEGFFHVIPPALSDSAASNIQPYTTAPGRQESTYRGPFNYRSEPTLKSYQYPHHFLPVPWQIQRLHLPRSALPMRSYHEIFSPKL